MQFSSPINCARFSRIFPSRVMKTVQPANDLFINNCIRNHLLSREFRKIYWDYLQFRKMKFIHSSRVYCTHWRRYPIHWQIRFSQLDMRNHDRIRCLHLVLFIIDHIWQSMELLVRVRVEWIPKSISKIMIRRRWWCMEKVHRIF